jgi:hypothetical protein
MIIVVIGSEDKHMITVVIGSEDKQMITELSCVCPLINDNSYHVFVL